MKIRVRYLLIVASLLTGASAAIYHYRNQLWDRAEAKFTAELKAKSAGECWYSKICGKLAYYDCGAADEAPAYYVDLEAQRTVGRCGGTCKGEMARCQSECPPSSWTCDLQAPLNPKDMPELVRLNEGLGNSRSLKAVLSPFDAPFALLGEKEEPVPEVMKKDAVFASPAELDKEPVNSTQEK